MELKRKTTITWTTPDGTEHKSKQDAMAHAAWKDLAGLIAECMDEGDVSVNRLKAEGAMLRRLILAATRGTFDRAGKQKEAAQPRAA